jgi:hypothetical protein
MPLFPRDTLPNVPFEQRLFAFGLRLKARV